MKISDLFVKNYEEGVFTNGEDSLSDIYTNLSVDAYPTQALTYLNINPNPSLLSFCNISSEDELETVEVLGNVSFMNLKNIGYDSLGNITKLNGSVSINREGVINAIGINLIDTINESETPINTTTKNEKSPYGLKARSHINIIESYNFPVDEMPTILTISNNSKFLYGRYNLKMYKFFKTNGSTFEETGGIVDREILGDCINDAQYREKRVATNMGDSIFWSAPSSTLSIANTETGEYVGNFPVSLNEGSRLNLNTGRLFTSSNALTSIDKYGNIYTDEIGIPSDGNDSKRIYDDYFSIRSLASPRQVRFSISTRNNKAGYNVGVPNSSVFNNELSTYILAYGMFHNNSLRIAVTMSESNSLTKGFLNIIEFKFIYNMALDFLETPITVNVGDVIPFNLEMEKKGI